MGVLAVTVSRPAGVFANITEQITHLQQRKILEATAR
jgi:hypothetical protein